MHAWPVQVRWTGLPPSRCRVRRKRRVLRLLGFTPVADYDTRTRYRRHLFAAEN
jgi:hypothetical protein